MSDLWNLTAFELREAIRQGDVTAVDAARSAGERIRRLDPELNAYITTLTDYAIVKAEEVDRKRSRGEALGPLAGVPVCIKDNFTTSFSTTTCGSRMLEDYHAPYDATAVRAILNADAVIVGKTNMDEFAMGSTTETSAFGPTRNPWALERVPGGSSGGTACAVAARLCFGGWGSDTGGSIRQPASFCGVTGLRPTYGRVSRYGMVAFGSSLDQIGPITRDVRDCALFLQVVAGHDPLDSTSAPVPVPDYLETIDRLRPNLTIGVPRRFVDTGCDSAVLAVINEVQEVYRNLGVTIVGVDLPTLDHATACYYIVAPAEASSNLARYDGAHYGHRTSETAPHGENATIFMYSKTREEAFGAEVKRRIMIGTHALSSGYYDAYYLKASKVRRLIKEDFDRVFTQADLVLLPASPTVPFPLGEKLDDPLAMYLTDVFTVSANLAGIPGLSLPGGFAGDLPVGFQLLAPPLAEETLLEAGFAFQRATDWHRRVPAVAEDLS